MWVGGSVAAVKQPQAVLPASTRPIFRLLNGRNCRLMVLSGSKRRGRHWRLVALRELRIVVMCVRNSNGHPFALLLA